MAPGGGGSVHHDRLYSESQAGPRYLASGWCGAGRCTFPAGLLLGDRAPHDALEVLRAASDVV